MSDGGKPAGRGRVASLLLNRVTLAITAIVVVGGIGLSMLFGERGGIQPGTTFVAKRGELAITVTAGGSVQALESQEIVSEIKGRDGAKILSIVEEGYRVSPEDVKNGLVLVELDSSQLEDELVNQEIAFQSAEAGHIEKKAQFEIQVNQNQSNITTAELTAKFALMDFEKYLGKRAVDSIVSQLELDTVMTELQDLKRAGIAKPSAPAPTVTLPPPGLGELPPSSESPGRREWNGQGAQNGGGREGGEGQRRRGEGQGGGSGRGQGGFGGGMSPERFKEMIDANGGKIPEEMAERLRQMGMNPEDIERQIKEGGMPSFPGRGQGGGPGGGFGGGMSPERFKQMIDANGGKIPEEMAARMREMGMDPDQIVQQMANMPSAEPANAPHQIVSTQATVTSTSNAVFVRDEDYSARRAKIDFASYADVNKLEDGQAKQELRQFDDKILVAQQDLGLAATSLEGKQRLAERNFITKNELDLEVVKKNKAEIQLEAAQVDRNLYVQYTFVKTAEKLLSDYEEALMNLERTMQEAAAKLSQADSALKAAEQRYNIELNQLNDLKDQLSKCVIRAERSGLVVYGSSTENNPFRRSNEEPIQEGTTVRERQRIITIPDMTKMGVKVNIHESAVNRVAQGQSASLRVDAFPDRKLTGTVDRVAVLADSANMFMNPDLKVYPTTVRIDGVYDWLRPGMSAAVEILVDTLHDVVYVPIQAVSYVGDAQVVYVTKAGVVSRRKVTTGRFTEEFIEIKSGLESGEEVLLLAPDAGKREKMKDEDGDGKPDEGTPAEAPQGEQPAAA